MAIFCKFFILILFIPRSNVLIEFKFNKNVGGKSGSGSHPTGYKLIDNFYILSIIGVKIWKVCYNDKNLM